MLDLSKFFRTVQPNIEITVPNSLSKIRFEYDYVISKPTHTVLTMGSIV